MAQVKSIESETPFHIGNYVMTTIKVTFDDETVVVSSPIEVPSDAATVAKGFTDLVAKLTAVGVK